MLKVYIGCKIDQKMSGRKGGVAY